MEDSTLIPLTGVLMMAIWVRTVLHPGAPPSFPGDRETSDFKGFLSCSNVVAERDGFASLTLDAMAYVMANMRLVQQASVDPT